METIHLPLMIETDEDGVYIISCPALKGCHSYGATIEEAMANIREVITMCLEEEKPENLNRFVGFRERAQAKRDTIDRAELAMRSFLGQ